MSLKIQPSEWRKKSRRNFLVLGASSLVGILGGVWILSAKPDRGLPWPLRAMLQLNEKVWRGLFNANRQGEVPASVSGPARVNGDIGLDDPPAQDWKLTLRALGHPDISVTLEQLRQMPQTETSTVFKCVEGWSQNISYKGVRFCDFLLSTKIPASTAYVGLETPDEEYYVSVDMESMLHPQTLLALELNGQPLTDEHGAPLRLVIPVKYGIKNLKRIGTIFLADERPPDYWTQRGYDWYSGL